MIDFNNVNIGSLHVFECDGEPYDFGFIRNAVVSYKPILVGDEVIPIDLQVRFSVPELTQENLKKIASLAGRHIHIEQKSVMDGQTCYVVDVWRASGPKIESLFSETNFNEFASTIDAERDNSHPTSPFGRIALREVPASAKGILK